MPCEKRWGWLFIYEPVIYTDFFAVILSLQPKTNDENSFRAAGPVTIFTRPRLVTDLTSVTNLATALEQTKVRAKAMLMRFFRQLEELSSSWQLRSTGNSMPSSKSHLAEQKEPVLHQGEIRILVLSLIKIILSFFSELALILSDLSPTASKPTSKSHPNYHLNAARKFLDRKMVQPPSTL